MSNCKGVCIKYKALKPLQTGRYIAGQKRCQECEIFIKWEESRCPCCKHILRTKSRNKKYKEILWEKKNNDL